MASVIGVLMPGDMGHGVGEALKAQGYDVITALDGRSDHTKMLAEKGGLRNVGSLTEVVKEAGLILSIVPPNVAVEQAVAVAAAMVETGARPVYADMNAIAPTTAQKVQSALPTDVIFIDGGIVGLNPIKSPPTRFYVSGPDTTKLEQLNSDAIKVIKISNDVGKASAMKMVYAAGTKGLSTLQTALLMTALQQGVLEPLLDELAYSQKDNLNRMRSRIPFLPADSKRWVPEMQEIAATFKASGVSDGFHLAAAETFAVMAKTPYAAETRQTLDKSRTLETALNEYVKHL